MCEATLVVVPLTATLPVVTDCVAEDKVNVGAEVLCVVLVMLLTQDTVAVGAFIPTLAVVNDKTPLPSTVTVLTNVVTPVKAAEVTTVLETFVTLVTTFAATDVLFAIVTFVITFSATVAPVTRVPVCADDKV